MPLSEMHSSPASSSDISIFLPRYDGFNDRVLPLVAIFSVDGQSYFAICHRPRTALLLAALSTETVFEDRFRSEPRKDLYIINTLLTGRSAQHKGSGSSKLSVSVNSLTDFMCGPQDPTLAPCQSRVLGVLPGSLYFKKQRHS